MSIVAHCNDDIDHNSRSDMRGHGMKAVSCKTIKPELQPYNLPDEVIDIADDIFHGMTIGVHRSRKRIKLLYWCSFHAYAELGIKLDRIEFGKIFGLTPSEVKTCDSLFSPLNTGYEPPQNETTPMKFIPQFCEKIGIDDSQLPLLTEIVRQVEQNDRSLMQENPKTLAAGFVKYFCKIVGVNLDPALLSSVTKKSIATIQVIERKIESAHNM